MLPIGGVAVAKKEKAVPSAPLIGVMALSEDEHSGRCGPRDGGTPAAMEGCAQGRAL